MDKIDIRRIGFFKRRQYNTRSAFSGTFGTLRTIRFGCCLADDDAAAAAAAAAVADGVAGDTPALFVVDCAIFGEVSLTKCNHNDDDDDLQLQQQG
ncbi:hypothetical protein DERP_004488 [Dermatophagoides pteronyssinus]|uniref:Uncharacterized protein n=1 Tax=Dermatophagoides pteronyssinus TaxID=6956 RepID=A0ABQ8JNX6_DERPT|nr:hypothetical protein DERP_004488 [Dermatophagoides pteronyssinus]